MKDFESLETVRNIVEIRGLVFGNLINATLLSKTNFNKNQEMIGFFHEFYLCKGLKYIN